MSTLPNKFEPVAIGVQFMNGKMLVKLADGRELHVPLQWFPRLRKASPSQRRKWELTGGGIGIHWPLLDEDISVENLLLPRVTHRKLRKAPARA